MYWDAEPAAWLVLQSVHRGVQVCCTSTTSPHQVSVLKSLAEMFDLKAFADVVVYGPIEPEDAAVTFVELHFKDQFISRGDMWLFTEAMMNLPVHRKKTFDLLGMRVSTHQWLPPRPLSAALHTSCRSSRPASRTLNALRCPSIRAC